jgi:hypothetical protein
MKVSWKKHGRYAKRTGAALFSLGREWNKLPAAAFSLTMGGIVICFVARH